MSRRVTVTLPDEIFEGLQAVAGVIESSVAAQLRRAARLLLRGVEPSGEVGFDPTEWRVTTWKRDDSGLAMILNARASSRSEGAHIVVAESEALFVLPDGESSGLKRSLTISEALADIEANAVDPLAYVAGRLLAVGAGEIHFTDSGEVDYGTA